MAEQWIIRVGGKEYGPADLATLREWKTDGRVLPTNPARGVDVDSAAVAISAKEAPWKTAGHSRSVSGRTATGAGKDRGKRQSGSDRVARGSLWQNRGRHGRHYNVKTAKSKHFGRNISNLFSRFLSILLPRVAEHRPDSLRGVDQSFHRHRAGPERRPANSRRHGFRIVHARAANCFDPGLHRRHPNSHRRTCDRTSDRLSQRPQRSR